jgi:hypothetical protein
MQHLPGRRAGTVPKPPDVVGGKKSSLTVPLVRVPRTLPKILSPQEANPAPRADRRPRRPVTPNEPGADSAALQGRLSARIGALDTHDRRSATRSAISPSLRHHAYSRRSVRMLSAWPVTYQRDISGIYAFGSAAAGGCPLARSSHVLPLRTLLGCSATMSEPGRAWSSRVLTKIQRRSPVRVKANPPASLLPCRRTDRWPGSSRMTSAAPSSQMITAPVPRACPARRPS